jgi:hypothetical protein
LPFVGHSPLRDGQNFGRDRIYQFRHTAKEAGRRYGFEPCYNLKRAIHEAAAEAMFRLEKALKPAITALNM